MQLHKYTSLACVYAQTHLYLRLFENATEALCCCSATLVTRHGPADLRARWGTLTAIFTYDLLGADNLAAPADILAAGFRLIARTEKCVRPDELGALLPRSVQGFVAGRIVNNACIMWHQQSSQHCSKTTGQEKVAGRPRSQWEMGPPRPISHIYIFFMEIRRRDLSVKDGEEHIAARFTEPASPFEESIKVSRPLQALPGP
jgi:hypothetical protein